MWGGGGRILVYVDWSAVLITAKLDRHFTSSIETMSLQNVSKFFDWNDEKKQLHRENILAHPLGSGTPWFIGYGKMIWLF